jgi:hypothetical protein
MKTFKLWTYEGRRAELVSSTDYEVVYCFGVGGKIFSR